MGNSFPAGDFATPEAGLPQLSGGDVWKSLGDFPLNK